MKIYDGTGMVLGRLATQVAKDALLGEEVRVVNCNQVVISGRKENTFAVAKQNRDRRGYPTKSRKIHRSPDRYVRRTIRGMLPWKQARGREAFKRIMCYNEVPEDMKENHITVAHAADRKLPTLRKVTVADVCKQLGGKA